MDYENQHIIDRFLERFEMPRSDAQDLFAETKKWLWLCSRHQTRNLEIVAELVMIDEMWHTFILFTKEYATYCHSRLGAFVHHTPATRAFKEARQEQYRQDPERFRQARRDAMREQMQFIAAELGGNTLLKWFVSYPQKFGREFFATRVAPAIPPLSAEYLGRLELIARRHNSE